MALIHCPECREKVSDKAMSCPKCGYPLQQARTSSLSEVVQSPRQWTGIAVMPDERVFVNFPRWSDDVPVSVAELLLRDGSVRPFPNSEWNEWNGGARGGPEYRFVCVQSVVADRKGYLWVLDSGNPCLAGVIPGAPKLLKFDTRDGSLLSKIPYAEPVILPPVT